MKVNLYKLHENQIKIEQEAKRYNVVNCGRRFGKNILQYNIGIKAMLQGKHVAHLSPTYKMQKQVWSGFKDIAFEVIKSKDEQHKQLNSVTNGSLTCFSFDAYNSIRGNKYDLVLMDEVAFTNYLEPAWNEAIRPTLLDYKGSAYFFSTPNGNNYFKTLANISNEEWQYFHFSTYDNPYIDNYEIDKLKETLPSIKFRQEILAEFVDMQGTLIQREWLQYYDYLPTKLDYYIGVDLAISQKTTADYTVISVIGTDGRNIYVVEIARDRYTFKQTQDVIKQLANKYEPEYVIVENAGYQQSMIQELIATTSIPIRDVKPKADKVSRALNLIGKYEHGLIYHNRNLGIEIENEILSFPNSQHDDVVDSLVYAISKVIYEDSTLMRVL